MNYGGGYEAYGNEDYGAGGFMDAGASQAGSQSQGSGGKRGGGRGARDVQTLLPITIRQLLQRTEAEDVVRIDNHEVSSVKVIGILSNVTPHSTNVNFQLDDGTGMMEGRMFLPSDDGTYAENEIAKLQDGMYVKAVGSVRSFQDKINLTCFSVTPIEDFNEITHHFLHAIYVHCYNTKGPLTQSAGGNMAQGFQMNNNQPQNSWNQPANANYLSHNQPTAMDTDYGMDSNFTPEQNAILDVLGKCTSDRGLKIDQIFMELRGQMTEDQLRSVLNYLTSEGHVYSTIDENHFKRTA